MIVRAECERDRDAIRALDTAAFGTAAEANLVDALRERARPVISLVAEVAGDIVGHIMFSPVSLGGHPDVHVMGLAPMVVAPAYQREGIGSALVRAGMTRCRDLGFGAVVVLGHPAYCPRFGFQPSVRFGIRCEYEAPAEAFMLVQLVPGYMHGVTGTVQFHPAFKGV
jgi:putative acetyltransferase